jgi:predicted ester cyclase
LSPTTRIMLRSHQAFQTGVAGLQQYFTLFRAAFPDLHYTVDDTVAEGDKVVQRVTGHGTMQGEFLGMLPTGKPATWTEIHQCEESA